MKCSFLSDLQSRTKTFTLLRRCNNILKYYRWLMAGKSGPTPHKVKQKTLKEYAQRHDLHIFAETGTYFGDMVAALRDDFDEIFSIELDEKLYQRARKKFGAYKHITILEGDSASVLPVVLDRISTPCLFWLDAHYSAGITAKGVKDTPILEEISHILCHSVQCHVIMIDDAHEFTGKGDYPRIEELQTLIKGRNRKLEVKQDIIFIL